MDWKEILKNSGFTLYEKCNCHGAYTEKYTDNEKVWKIKAVPGRRLFSLYKHGVFFKKTFLFKLKETLENYEIIEKAI